MISISFLGDIALVGKYNELYKRGENPFSDLKEVLFDSDFVIGNLECLSEGDKGENLLKKPRLKTKLKTLNYLKNLNISGVSLAHNHVYDNLEDGFKKTTKFLDSNNIKFLGAGYSDEIAEKPLFLEKDGIKICFLNYVTHDTNPNLPDYCKIKLNWFDEEKIKNDISKYKSKVNHIVLLLHWGGDYEGSNYPNPIQSVTAKRLIDYGADLIIGHHSHTFQPYEIYKGKYIFHSLGNFCFADWESDGNMYYVWPKRKSESAIISAEFTDSKYNISIQPIENQKNKIKLLYYNKIISKNKKFEFIKKIIGLDFIYRKIYIKIERYFHFFFNPKLSFKNKINIIKEKLI